MRIGIIGFGVAGQAHCFYFSCVAGCRVTKIFDPKPAAAERAATRAAAATFCSDEDRFWPDLDVVVCTPDSTHAAITDFVAAIRDRRRPLCSIDGAGRTVLACLAGVESYRTNRLVAVRQIGS